MLTFIFLITKPEDKVSIYLIHAEILFTPILLMHSSSCSKDGNDTHTQAFLAP